MSEINKPKKKIVVFTGAGVSAESGIETFRAETGLWNNHDVMEVCHPSGWHKNPRNVLNFYNDRREDVRKAKPNLAHLSIAKLEQFFDVVVITQNIDNLHERAGSTHVIHVHGEITKVRSDNIRKCKLYDIGYQPTNLGELCEYGFQLRPHIVWFDEAPLFIEEAEDHFRTADKVLVVGTSLQVYPAAALPSLSIKAEEKVLVALGDIVTPHGFKLHKDLATQAVPNIVDKWIALI